MQYTWSLLKREMTEREKRRRHGDAPQRSRQNTQEDHPCHRKPFIFLSLHSQHTYSLPRPDSTSRAVDQRRERGSHATGAGTGAPPGGIYSRPALKGRERGHACFPFHSLGTFTRPHMWVLNIYPNTGSNILGKQRIRGRGVLWKWKWAGMVGGREERRNEGKKIRKWKSVKAVTQCHLVHPKFKDCPSLPRVQD